MITPELAKKQLDAWRMESGDRLLSEAKGLPEKLRAIAYALLERTPSGERGQRQESVDEQLRARQEAIGRFDRLSPKERQPLWTALSGDLAPAMEAAWRSLKSSTYQTGYTRKSFRAPNDPSVTLFLRQQWVKSILAIVGQFQPGIVTTAWLAAWTPHLGYRFNQDAVGRLLAAVIGAGGPLGDEVFDILCRSTSNEHEIGTMGRHVSRALLMASRPEGWELMEKTLLAAQRQEGLRQVILETVDEAHPEAYRRMLRLIRDHDLARFSAVVRAVNVWFGLMWDSVSVKIVNATINQVLDYLDDPRGREKALAGRDSDAIFLALWSIAFTDAMASIPEAARLLTDKKTEIRFVAALHLGHLALPQTRTALFAALGDEDLRVADCALSGVAGAGIDPNLREDGEGLFERLERLFPRFPRKKLRLKPLDCPWNPRVISQEEVARCLFQALGDRPATALIAYLPALAGYQRRRAVEILAAQKKWDGLTRQALVGLVGDAIADVRAAAYGALAKVKLQAGEIEILERYLTRKASDLRQGVLGLLLRQTDAAALASADRLTASTDALQRSAGLEILRQLAQANRGRTACQQRAGVYRAARKKLSDEEQGQIDAIVGAAAEKVTIDNALGLMDPAQRSPAVPPEARKVRFLSDAAVACIHALDDLVHQHRETPVKFNRWRGEETEELLGNVQYGFPSPNWREPPEKSTVDLPLAEVWEQWYAGRPEALRDTDGLELVRAEAWLDVVKNDWEWERYSRWGKGSEERRQIIATLSCGFQRPKLRYAGLVNDLVDWLLFLHPPAQWIDFLLDATETAFALVPESEIRTLAKLPESEGYSLFDAQDPDWRNAVAMSLWCDRLDSEVLRLFKTLTPQQVARWWRLLRWRDEPFAGAARKRPKFLLLFAAYGHEEATLADIVDNLLGPGRRPRYGAPEFESLAELTQRKLSDGIEGLLACRPEVRQIVEQCRARIVEIELARGESPTAATAPAWCINSLWGTDLLVRFMTALGKQGFKVPVVWQKTVRENKVCTLTQLASVTLPKAGETHDDFYRLVKKAVAEGRLSDKVLLELAFLAPQWAKHVERYLGWDGLSESLYWFLAHMCYAGGREDAAIGAGIKDEPKDSQVAAEDQKTPSPWERLIAERTPLTDVDLAAGAVDVGWFRQVYAQVTPKRWLAMAEAARFAANAAQARHAQFVAEVLTGRARRKQLVDGVRKKRLKDYVRLLGLYPLAEGAKRQTDLVERYNVLQEYHRHARGLSAMSKPEALQSVEVGMKNLASTAGYADPLRLEWAMEAEQVKRLAAGPLSVTKEGVTVTLALDAEARPQISIQRAGKPLKSVPPALKKDKHVAELAEQAAHLKRQASRMKASLEAAMCRGDSFSAAELGQLCRHAILSPLLCRLVLAGEGILGYPDRDGQALRDARGKLEPVKKDESLRIAHAHDLLASGIWDQYQRECFQAERVQPFKQVFRELYVVTKQEKRDRTISRRYAGQQVQPQQAFALWGQRGWSTQDGVWKTFHDAGLTASVYFQYGAGTPLDVEGLTIEGVEFRRRNEIKPMELGEVPARTFSEAMRDVDLVVSVAHRGGVDPEASASTVEMRAALLRETCALLGLRNVRTKDSHVLVDGQLGNYSIHLGSATVHRLPGGAICLVAVPAEHRGRLFLPFADDDPRTAEVISKAILLARDAEIQDPTIIEQLRA